MPEVKCSVANCTYWAQGNNCAAEAIMVDIDQHANANFKEEIGEIGYEVDTDHKDNASNSSQTCCHTFMPRSKR
ncbi:DUF1540 domain-containing protein [Aneurinibacillus tyrosinisolvens]|uniref:DUF1540 domain-containing protein n=1 Tax=Aneurinibacillus tyrosinisolvens TaxID=1443435 RepID=UPI00063F9C0E|nr:DUF1540 domain-containing protein [Aneurinibacillus tyrosinisolvens]